MEKIFLTVLNMTFTASFVIAAIIIARLFLKKTPKIISYTLWIAAGFRLVFPFSIESVLSLIPFKSQPIPQDIVTQAVPRINTGIPTIDNAVSNILPVASQTNTSINPMQILITSVSIIWIVGIATMLIYSIISVVTVKRRINGIVLIEDDIYEANIKTPFVMGFFKPKIYLPANLPDSEKDYILLHERTHIKRNDNIVKLFAYLILSLHWFNPLVWAAFILMSMDLEMSCDERVLKEYARDETSGKIKKAYSMSILSLATGRHTINIYPLAFGEGDTKRRIMNVLNYKKYSKIKITVALILTVALTVGFMLNNSISADNSQENDDFRLAAEFLANNSVVRVITEDDITTGTDNVTRKDMAFYTARLRNPGISGMYPFYETKMEVLNEQFGFTGYVPDLENKLFDEAINYCIENGIMDSSWFSDPEAAVTLQDAVKMLVIALKYDGIADNEYITKAATKEIRLLGKYAVFPFAGISADKTLTKNDAIMLAYNFMMSEYAVDIESTVTVLHANYDLTLEINPHLTIDDIPPGSLYRRQEPITYRSVINTFGVHIATPISSKVTVDGKEISFDAYNIDGSNYFKIRDIAYVLNGTVKQFSIHDGNMFMRLTVGAPYTYYKWATDEEVVDGSIGYEMSSKGTSSVTATGNTPNEFEIMYADNRNRVDKFVVEMYEINGSYYYKLRDLAEALNFNVDYDGMKNTIIIDTGNPYPNRTPIIKDYYPPYPAE